MLLLTSTSDLVRVVTGSSGAIAVHADWVDNASGTITPGRTNTASITGTTTTTVVASPGASTQRNVKMLSVRNTSASVSNAITINHTDGTNSEDLWGGTLAPSESVVLGENGQWQYLDANGAPKLSTGKLDAWVRVSGSDYTNSTTSQSDITGLSVAVKNGKNYIFETHLYYQTAATTTGAQFAVGGPSMTALLTCGLQTVTNSVTGAAVSTGTATAVNTVLIAQTTGPGTTNVLGIISGYFTPSADGTFTIRGVSEVAASALTVKVGSWLHVRETDN